jgi:hypothetical protein
MSRCLQTAKPPASSMLHKDTKSDAKKHTKESEDAGDEIANLKNDLALQRLLKESHLLDSASDFNPTGKNRHRAIDLRMQSLGSNVSLFAQQKMPMSHRTGIKGKATKKEVTRRREAKENGVILEKPAFTPKKSSQRRERGVGAPSIGKFAGGTLKLSTRDLMSIRGPSRTSKGSGRGRR